MDGERGAADGRRRGALPHVHEDAGARARFPRPATVMLDHDPPPIRVVSAAHVLRAVPWRLAFRRTIDQLVVSRRTGIVDALERRSRIHVWKAEPASRIRRSVAEGMAELELPGRGLLVALALEGVTGTGIDTNAPTPRQPRPAHHNANRVAHLPPVRMIRNSLVSAEPAGGPGPPLGGNYHQLARVRIRHRHLRLVRPAARHP